MLARWLVVVTGLAAALAVVAVGCGDDEASEEDTREVEQTIRDLAATGPENVDFFLEHATDNFLEEFAGYTREECRQPENVEDCVGEPSEGVELENLEVDGERAEVDATFTDGEDEFAIHLVLVKEDDVWKIDAFAAPVVEIPEGVKSIEVTADEYEFQFNEEEISGGNIAFVLKNEGDEQHELDVFKVTDDFDITSILGDEEGQGGEEGSEEEFPPGIEEVAGFTFAGPGESANLVFESELEPGRYIIVCFIEAEDRTPHANLGMHAEFTIE